MLDEIQDALRSIQGEMEGSEIDVRLRVFEGGWTILFGSPQFDTDHRGVWSAGTISISDDYHDLRYAARDLLQDAWHSTQDEDVEHWPEDALGLCEDHGWYLVDAVIPGCPECPGY